MKRPPLAFILLSAASTLAATAAPLEEAPSPGSPQIILDQASPDIFPESWRTPRVGAAAAPLEETEIERCRRIVEQALDAYPADLLEATLKKVYCLGHLEYRGVSTGGTRSRSAVYVVCKPRYSSADVERILHAEYSSVLFNRYPEHFDAETWGQLNPPDFAYLGGGVGAIQSGQMSRKPDGERHAMGFLHEYAMASIEEDFNSHAARLLVGDADYWEAIGQHPKLKAKSDLAIAFYAKVHAELDKAYFEKRRYLVAIER